MSFPDDLRAQAAPVWDAQLQHPFIRGIADGTLERGKFLHWVRQDYLFLIEYSRMLATASARAPDLAAMTRLAELTQETLVTEMSLHRAYAARAGIDAGELEREVMAPTTRAYTDFLVRVAATGDFAEIAGALLPCMWGFSELGLALAKEPAPSVPTYSEWIDMYSAPEFADLATWCRGLLDQAVEGLPDAHRARVADAFLTSSRYEYLFWDMAWNLETWPV